MSTLALLLKGQLHKSDLLGAELINHNVRVSFRVGGVDIIYTNRTIAVKFLSPDVPGWTVAFHSHPSRYGNIMQVVDSVSGLTPLKGCVSALALTVDKNPPAG